MQAGIQTSIQWPLTVFYDHSCQLCRSEMHNIKARDHADVLRLVDASDATALARHSTDKLQQDLMALLHARDAAGVWYVGVDAFVVIYQATDMGWVGRVLNWPGVHALAKALYPSVARNRYRLPSRLLSGFFEVSRQRAKRRLAQAAAQNAHWQANRCQAGRCELGAYAEDGNAAAEQAAGPVRASGTAQQPQQRESI
ncbi:thiol-disulfide oxidoreductase DCC family protein [Lampropedia aestuarii]|uniref:thiol-disulfide oxidoreductase DCC family protein n=1 Tax=Lampropedia aestuarii TaxID=2562762 RepID=UPI00246977FC|nr:DUF393 domain-containing protein [Lampropedia aestuarii]MDH5855896.1 DUF393 domain-containing protein [Lampropedia aestuarii]